MKEMSLCLLMLCMLATTACVAQEPLSGEEARYLEEVEQNPSAPGGLLFAMSGEQTQQEAVMLAGPTMTIELDPSSTYGIVLAGKEQELGRFRFTATDLTQEVRRLFVGLPYYFPIEPVVSISLYNENGALVGGPVPVDMNLPVPGSLFDGISFVVAPGGTRMLTIKGALASLATAGVRTGMPAVVRIATNGNHYTSGLSNYEARGVYPSGEIFTANSALGNPSGPLKILRGGRFTIDTIPLPNSTTWNLNGDQVVLQIRITVDPEGGPVSIPALAFRAETRDNPGTRLLTVSRPRLFNNANHTQFASSMVYGSMPACSKVGTFAACDFQTIFDPELNLQPGQTIVGDLVLRFDGANSGEYVRTYLARGYLNGIVSGELHYSNPPPSGFSLPGISVDDLDGIAGAMPLTQGTIWSDFSPGHSFGYTFNAGVRETWPERPIDYTTDSHIPIHVLVQLIQQL